jgi:MFS family permease
LFVVAFVVVSRTAPRPLIAPKLLIEVRFLRSSVAAFAQMFCLAAVLVTVPLYLTGSLGKSSVTTGLLVFSLPAAMALLAPAVGALGDRAGPRRMLRTGLVVLAAALLLLGFRLDNKENGMIVLTSIMFAVGAGIALVQTPSASGATRSQGGRSGAALGLFNMVRFAGSALGTAWVAVAYPHSSFTVLFGGCAVVAAIGLGMSFAGRNPAPPPLDASAPAAMTA